MDAELIETYGQRVKMARAMRMLSVDALCARMGNTLPRTVVMKMEAGNQMPNSATLMAICRATELPVDYFFRPVTLNTDELTLFKSGKLGIRQVESINELIRDHAERWIELEELTGDRRRFELAGCGVVTCAADVHRVVRYMREQWHVTGDGINGLIALIEATGVKVMQIDAPEGFDSVSGMARLGRRKVAMMALNSHLNSDRKRFTALAEFGRMLMQFGQWVLPKERETWCYTFANEMLLPGELFNQRMGWRRGDLTPSMLRPLEAKFGISIDALMYKAKVQGLVSESKYVAYFKMKNSVPTFKEEVERCDYPQEHPTELARRVRAALERGLISEAKACVLLGVRLNDLHTVVGEEVKA